MSAAYTPGCAPLYMVMNSWWSCGAGIFEEMAAQSTWTRRRRERADRGQGSAGAVMQRHGNDAGCHEFLRDDGSVVRVATVVASHELDRAPDNAAFAVQLRHGERSAVHGFLPAASRIARPWGREANQDRISCV
jgi:hypothetical protein